MAEISRVRRYVGDEDGSRSPRKGAQELREGSLSPMT